ncbi:hypothetical protein [Deinococcus sp. ME38]|uniref:hypothetical protein n=1 Tax=Deinococcus sp. ME38 TaxID=3400344 RepID=UPI003B5B00C9
MKRLLFCCAALLAGTAHADTRISGTSVSYKIKTETLSDTNASMVFIDALEDPSGKTYVAFVCDLGEPFARIYSNASLGRTGDTPPVYARATGGSPRTLNGTVREDLKTGKPTVLDTTRLSTDQLMRALIGSDRVTVRIERERMSALILTFRSAGFTKAWQAINNCD